ncbi:Protein of unknown function DUF639 [Dillenia turbinata]|uniref:DUF639 domain-containing protein n=1 Tax=Dillenia turbinata TaxID=194707 RepID=A0AAN8UYD0_9MAGN
MENRKGLLENFVESRHMRNAFESLFHRRRGRSSADDSGISDDGDAPRNSHIPYLSPFANSVVARCSKILKISIEDLQHRFDTELPDTAKQTSLYARNFLEFCSCQALPLITGCPDYLSDKEFIRLTFDLMIAWEGHDVDSEQICKDSPSSNCDNDDGWSLFYSSSTNMAVQVDERKTVGPEAFARIAPICTAVADTITVHNLFDSLTISSSNRLHFLIYDKYIRSLDKVIKAAKQACGSSAVSNLRLAEGEIILDTDGTVPTKPVLQHIGVGAWPGRLTLTNYALYFESLGVALYDKAVRYELSLDMKQVIKPELTGPLGARIFDKAVMYKSISIAEPVFLEFPEFKGNSRRDYWLDICLEILHVHKFIRKYNLKDSQQSEALARAIMGIFQYRAVREAFNFCSSPYKTLLAFNLAESLPGGDVILETLSSRLALLNAKGIKHDSPQLAYAKQRVMLSPFSYLTLIRFGFILGKGEDVEADSLISFGDFCVGETNPLEMAVKQSKCDTGRAAAAQATVDQVKVEGIDTNLAVLKGLLFPAIKAVSRLQYLASWEDPPKSSVFLLVTCYVIHRGWIKFILPSFFMLLSLLMIWQRLFNNGQPIEAFRVILPPNRNAVEQLLMLQDGLAQIEALLQAGNITLLKMRALIFAVLPQATDTIALLLIVMAVVFAFLPFRYLVLSIFLEAFTREMPLRKESSNRWLRRIREWWIRIPAAPVHIIKLDQQ